MRRDYHKWFSPSLGRDMEMLVFSPDGDHNALPAIVFPTSCGRFFEFEDRGMVSAIQHRIDSGNLQLFCVDSVDAESWYNRNVGPRWRIARHMQYEDYLMREVLPLVRQLNHNPRLIAAGCSFGGYHSANIGFRHPDLFTGFLSMGGAFDPSNFLRGYHDQDCYFNIPTQYLPNMSDSWFFDRYRQNTYVLATGEHDICLHANETLAHIMNSKHIPVRLDVWRNNSHHDWPCWHQMIKEYL